MPITKLSMASGKPSVIPYGDKPKREYDRAYNQRRQTTDTEYVKFYHSAAWHHKRREILERDYGLCQRCGKDANLVDHIIPSKDDWEDRLDSDNLECLCRECHKIKTKREWYKHHKSKERYMEINLVCGLPGAGKSTYVKRHMTDHDLIYDYDDLMQALTGLPSRHRNHDVHDYVMLFLDQMLRKLKAEQSFNNVWIIRTLPDHRIDSLLANYHHINHILIDTDASVCEARIAKRKQKIQFQKILNDYQTADWGGYRRVKNC